MSLSVVMAGWLVTILMIAPTAGAVHGTASPAPEVVPNMDSCVARLDPQLDIGYDRIAARCPDLMLQLETGAWAPWLPRGWKEPGNDLSAGSLKEFRQSVERESATRESNLAAEPDVRSLQPILTALAGDRNESGWSRFKSWLRSVLERRDQPTDESWFSQMVSHVGVSQSVIRLITYAALAAVVALAGIIVVNELRTAGLFGQRRALVRRRHSQAARGGASGMNWSDIEQAPLRDRPRLLLELIVRKLSDRGSLPPSGALTVRELTLAARLSEPDDRLRLSELALATERARYSAVEPQVAGLAEPIARGRELLERIRAGTAVLDDDVGVGTSSSVRAGTGTGAGSSDVGRPSAGTLDASVHR